MTLKSKRLEFFMTPRGRVMYQINDNESYLYQESDIELSKFMLDLIERQYPEALIALNQMYSASKLNRVHYDYLRVSRFIRCNFGNYDGLTHDVQDEVLHIEDVSCPLREECTMSGIICKPKPFGLTERETEVASMIYSGMSYDEASIRLRISPFTIKNTIQNIRKKLKLGSTKDVAKFFIAIL